MSELQWRICNMRMFFNLSYRGIREYYSGLGVTINNDQALVRCFLRTALGLRWDVGDKGGRDPYLCPEDTEELISAVSSSAESLDSSPTCIVLNYAHELKIDRLTSAFKLLRQLHCDGLADKLELTVAPPTRAWLCDFVDRFNLRIRAGQRLDAIRRKTCDKQRITRWFRMFESIIAQYDPELILNMDETGLSTNNKFKVVVPEGVFPVVPGGKNKEAHITGIVTFSAMGKVFRPGVILSKLRKLPDELQQFAGADFYTSKTGWMTRELFELYALNLAHEVTRWRLELPPSKRCNRILLIVDGHGSRKTAKGMAYLAQHGIDLLTLPGHSTHVLQPFDVTIAAAIKMKMAKEAEEWARRVERGAVVAQTAAGTKRFVLVSSFLEAVDSVVTKKLCRTAFMKSGIVPLQSEIPLSSPLILPDSRFEHPDDWISSSFFGCNSLQLIEFCRQSHVTLGTVTSWDLLIDKTDLPLTPIQTRLESCIITNFQIL